MFTWDELRGFLKIAQLYAPPAYSSIVKVMTALRTPQEARQNAIPLLHTTLEQLIAANIDFKGAFPKHKIMLGYINLVHEDFENQAIQFLMQLYALIKINIYKGESPAKARLKEEDLLAHLDIITASLIAEVVAEMDSYREIQMFKTLTAKSRQLLYKKNEPHDRLSQPRETSTDTPSAAERPASPATTARNLVGLGAIFDKMGAALKDVKSGVTDAMLSSLPSLPDSDSETDDRASPTPP